jgi:hypothetical protein
MPILGVDTVFETAEKDVSNFAYATERTMTEDGDITSVSVHCFSGSSDNATLGIYDDTGAGNKPGSAPMADGDGGVPPVGTGNADWYTDVLDSPLSLTNGDRVYLGEHNDSDLTIHYDSVSTPTDETWRIEVSAYTAGVLPSTTGWSINSPGSNYYKWSWYATYTATGGGGINVLRRRRENE